MFSFGFFMALGNILLTIKLLTSGFVLVTLFFWILTIFTEFIDQKSAILFPKHKSKIMVFNSCFRSIGKGILFLTLLPQNMILGTILLVVGSALNHLVIFANKLKMPVACPEDQITNNLRASCYCTINEKTRLKFLGDIHSTKDGYLFSVGDCLILLGTFWLILS